MTFQIIQGSSYIALPSLVFDSGAALPLRKSYLLKELKQTEGEENCRPISLGFHTPWGGFFPLFYK